MKIDRRSFLSLGIGAAAGVTLSPLPWKLTDDLSIWTQMWPWTPVPADGEATYTNSVCTLCPGGCGIAVRKVDDRAVKIEGMEGYPGNGKACPLGLSGLQLLYGPTAVQTPLKRADERGGGQWQKITWEEAIAEISEKLGKLREEGKAQTLGCIADADAGTVPELFKRFLAAYGSPNFMKTPTYQDAYELTFKLMHGAEASAGFDVENTDFVLSFGSGIIEGWGTPGHMFKAHSAWKDKKVSVIQVEPRLSNTAAKADRWLPINPGTEAVLALGLAHVIIKEGLYNKDFAEKYSVGFEDWKDSKGKARKGFKSLVMSRYTPSYVSGITGIDTDAIETLAKEFAGASNPLALCGRGQGRTPGAIHEFMAVHALNALVGNINKKGGIWATRRADYVNWPAPELDEAAQKGLKVARADGAGTEQYPSAKYLTSRLANAINTAEESPIQALLVADANPCYTLPDTQAVRAAFAKIPFIVSFAAYMNETTDMADIILPIPGHLERYEDVPTPDGMSTPVVGLAKPVIAPQYDSKPAGDAVMLLAKKMGGSVAKAFPWGSYEDCLAKTLGGKWKTLEEKGFVADDKFSPAGWDQAFATPSKKFQFMSEACQHDGKSASAASGIEGDGSAYKLLLIPYDSLRLASGTVANTPFLTKTVADTILTGKDIWVEINPKTGGKCGLAEGVCATLTTPKGSVKVRVHFSDGMMPGVIAMPRGLGHTGTDAYLAEKGVNFNELIGPVEDPASGLDAAWGIRANLVIA